MENVIVIAVVLLIVGLAARYVYKAKKSGRKCIGCPEGCCSCKSESASCNGSCCCDKHEGH